MPNSIYDASPLRNEPAAYAYVEARIWPNGRVCPHCGVLDKSGALKGKSTRIGVYKCYACRKPFTVKVGTIFEDSHVPLHLWLQAVVMMCSSKKGISSNQLHRTLGVTLRTAWHMSHRIRLAMAGHSDVFGPVGGKGKVIEIDETYIGKKSGYEPEPNPWKFSSEYGWYKDKRSVGGTPGKIPVVTLVERGGIARSIKAENVTAAELRRIVFAHADTKSDLMTDQANAIAGSVGASRAMKASTTAKKNGHASSPMEPRRIPTPSKASSRSSSAGCVASISTVTSATCTAIWPNSISATATASPSASMTRLALRWRFRVLLASG
jgi:transposase-like protein